MHWPSRGARLHLLRGVAAASCAAAIGLAATPAHAASWGPVAGGGSETKGTLRIAGGSEIPITEAPWQVRLRLKLNGATGICGGSIIDERHIVTAAHCTYDDLNPLTAGEIIVVSGSSSFDPKPDAMPANGPTPPDQPVSSTVAAIRRHPGYVPSALEDTSPSLDRDDAAVLTLSAPLTLDGVVRQAITLPERNTDLAVGTVLSFSGFGVQSDLRPQPIDGRLRRLSDMRLLNAVTRIGELNGVYLIATSDAGLGCSGDSGGPLVSGSGPAAVLVGLLAYGDPCQPGNTTVFTKVAAAEMLDFIAGSDTPPAAPTGGRDILLTANRSGALPLTPGRVLTCFPGTWTHSPSITISFFDDTGAVRQEGTGRTYTVAAGDVGKRIACRAVARTDGGIGRTPDTGFPPEVENGSAASVGGARRAKLSVALRVRTTDAYRGSSVGVTIRLYSRAAATAINAQACVAVPPGWRVVRRGGAKVSGSSVCLKTRSLRQYTLLYTTISLRPGTNAKTGLVKLKVRAAADNASAAFSSRTFRVF